MRDRLRQVIMKAFFNVPMILPVRKARRAFPVLTGCLPALYHARFRACRWEGAGSFTIEYELTC